MKLKGLYDEALELGDPGAGLIAEILDKLSSLLNPEEESTQEEADDEDNDNCDDKLDAKGIPPISSRPLQREGNSSSNSISSFEMVTPAMRFV